MENGLRELLERDHARLDGLLRAAAVGGHIDPVVYEEFRAGLLRHIGLEEKILLPAARRLRGGDPLEIARQLKLDHSERGGGVAGVDGRRRRVLPVGSIPFLAAPLCRGSASRLAGSHKPYASFGAFRMGRLGAL